MNWLKKLFNAIGAYFRSGQAAKDATMALSLVGQALPWVTLVGDISTKYILHTPGEVDDVLWASFKAAFPTLFDGKAHSNDEVKGVMLRAAAWLLQKKVPGIDMSVATAAAQNAYFEYRALRATA